MAARSLKADGRTIRYHWPLFEDCEQDGCQRRHATWGELDDFREESRQRDCERGVAAGKAE